MKVPSIKLLKFIANEQNDKNELMKIIKVKKRQFKNLTEELIKQNFIEGIDSKFILKQTPHAILFRDISKQYDIEMLLKDNNELVFYNLAEPLTITELQD